MDKKYTLIKGTFHVVKYSPDGDSMMFKANEESRWNGWKINRDPKDSGAVQLRLQGIDALETHYSPDALDTPSDLVAKETDKIRESRPKQRRCKQPGDLADKAAKEFMKIMGVPDAHWKSVFDGHFIDWAMVQKKGKTVKVETKLADGIEGYIVTNGIDNHGRPLAWVFADKNRSPDGKSLSDSDLIKFIDRSANYKLLEAGLVYPYFFKDDMSEKLTDKLRGVAQKAAEQLSGVWAKDKTNTGVKISTVEKLQADVIFPDLFRKMVKGWYQQNMQLYWDAMRKNKKFDTDPEKTIIDLKILFNGNRTRNNSGGFFEVKKDGKTVLMTKKPWEVVF